MKRQPLVRYHGLFASPVWLALAEAERILRREDATYLRLVAVGIKADAPRIVSVHRGSCADNIIDGLLVLTKQ